MSAVEAFEREMWPKGPAHGSGSGIWAKHRDRIIEEARARLADENARLRAAVAEADRHIDALRERIHPTMDGYCPACGGGCLIGFATPTPARTALESPREER